MRLGDLTPSGYALGDTPASAVYAGDTKVWQSSVPMGMDKSGTYELPTVGAWHKIQGFVTRSGYPDTVISNDSLVVQGGTYRIRWRGDYSVALGTQQFRVVQNNSTVLGTVNRAIVGDVTTSLETGDTLELQGYASASYRTVSAGSTTTYLYMDLV